MTPVQYREQGSHMTFRLAGSQPEGPAHEVEIRWVAPVHLAGLDHRGSYMKVGKAFETAFMRLSAQGLARPDSRWMAVYFDDPFAVPESQLASRAGLSLPAGTQASAPLVPFTLGGTPCAVLRHRGPYATMREAYRWLYGSWLVKSGHETADLPVFEEYLNNPRDTAPADLVTDIFLPLLKPD